MLLPQNTQGSYSSRMKQIERQRQMAEALRTQAMNARPREEFVQGTAGPMGNLPNIRKDFDVADILNPALKGAIGGYYGGQADAAEAENERIAREQAQQAVETMPTLDSPTSASDLLQWGASQDLSNPYIADTATEARKGGLGLALAEIKAKRGLGADGSGTAKIQEYNFLKGLSPEEQELWFKNIRNNPLYNFGGAMAERNPVTGQLTFTGKTPTPDAVMGLETAIRASASTPEATEMFIQAAGGDAQQAAILKEQWVAEQIRSRSGVVGSIPPGQQPRALPQATAPVQQQVPGTATAPVQPQVPGTVTAAATPEERALIAQGGTEQEIIARLNAQLGGKPAPGLPQATKKPTPLVSPVETKRREAEAAAAGALAGKSQEEARQALPAMQANIEMIDKHINEIQQLPAYKDTGTLGYVLGKTVSEKLGLSTEAGAVEARLKQLDAEALGPAYDMLRGTGAIATAEGLAATRAYNRAHSATTMQELNEALLDFQQRMRNIYKTLQLQARGGVLVDQNMENIPAVPARSTSKAPAGVPQQDWDYMTPEERALYQ